MRFMKTLLVTIAAASLMSVALAEQTGAQASASGNSTTSVQAGQANANLNSSSSANADAEASRQSPNANASAHGSASDNSAASVNGKSVSTGTNGAGSLASGTTIPATLTKPIDARKAKPGDEVAAKTTEDVRSASGVVIPRGSRLVRVMSLLGQSRHFEPPPTTSGLSPQADLF